MTSKHEILVDRMSTQLSSSLNVDELLRLMKSFGFEHVDTLQGCAIYENQHLVVYLGRHSTEPDLVGQVACNGLPGSGNEQYNVLLVSDDSYVGNS